jgi:hypothetical protein
MRNLILALLPVVLCVVLLTVHAVMLMGERRKDKREGQERDRTPPEGGKS